jgi:hypothetical protein
MSSVRQRCLFGCQLIAGWPLIVSNRLDENEPITSLKLKSSVSRREPMEQRDDEKAKGETIGEITSRALEQER